MAESLFLTSLTAPEIGLLFRKELDRFFDDHKEIDPTPKEEQLLSLKEAAVFIKLSVSSMYRLCNEKKIPNLKRGGKILFHKDELLAWAEEGRRKTVMEKDEDAERHLEKLGKKGVNPKIKE